MRRIIILGNGHREGVTTACKELQPLFEKHFEIVLIDLKEQNELINVEADLCLVLGGDGSILHAARQMGYRQRPVMGINLGRLGFLADLKRDELETLVPRIGQGEYRVTEHLMFEACWEIPGQPGSQRKWLLGLNDVAVQTGPPFGMIEMELSVHGETVARYSGDGLIVCTPIGSTAHSLSAGGPILAQELSAFVVTPMCAHGLTTRPLVDSADNEYIITVTRGVNANVVVDARETQHLPVGSRVRIRKAPVRFQLARVAGRSYYYNLHEKLFWGVQPVYRPEQKPGAERKAEGSS